MPAGTFLIIPVSGNLRSRR